MIKELIVKFIQVLARIIGYIPALIYGYVYSEYFTKYKLLLFRATYKRIAERNDPPAKKVLDIGTATGHPLFSIINGFKDAEVVGIDIDKNYVPACQKLFKNHPNVTIKLLNFYDLSLEFPETRFDTIIFGSSFMLMPDQSKAIELAKSTKFFYFRASVKERQNLLPSDSLRLEKPVQ